MKTGIILVAAVILFFAAMVASAKDHMKLASWLAALSFMALGVFVEHLIMRLVIWLV